ncbi:MAG: lamin tail domain-containing protein [Phycisphaerales bacterium JB040]
MKTAFAVVAVAGLAAVANADVTINEILGSTTSTDDEFIELYNTGGSAIDLTGWSLELWDSDAGSAFGGVDGFGSLSLSGSIAAGGYFLLANAEFGNNYSATPDQTFANNGIENSSYTVVLRDATSAVIETLFVTDGGAGDAANIAGTTITADSTVGPDGTFLPAGGYRIGDGGANWGILEFSTKPAPSATPGAANIPAPASLALLGLGGLAAGRRRRA